ncbi:MAG TPA: hypothetical protein VE968_06805, partial [Sphingomicrobium sp.]|nr:hypothetical protein [Sphingomicrobium sp.]
LAAIKLPPLFIALIVAELFFKFHSFTLEAIPFLALWYILRRLYAPLERWASARLARRAARVV